jgi:hypothetical protein
MRETLAQLRRELVAGRARGSLLGNYTPIIILISAAGRSFNVSLASLVK